MHARVAWLGDAPMKIEPSSLLLRSQVAFEPMAAPQLAQSPIAPAADQPASGSGFLRLMEGAVLSVDAQGRAASERMAAVDAGHSDDLVGAMLSSQEAGLSFSMLMQVRNKVMGAVDEVVKLQV